MRMQAAYLLDPETGEAVHVGDYEWLRDDPNQGVPASLWDDRALIPVFIEYDSETGAAEWWPPMSMGPGPQTPPWSHPTAAFTMSREEMYRLADEALG